MNLKFGTDGIRGPVETHITPEACLKIGHATGLVMKEQGWQERCQLIVHHSGTSVRYQKD